MINSGELETCTTDVDSQNIHSLFMVVRSVSDKRFYCRKWFFRLTRWPNSVWTNGCWHNKCLCIVHDKGREFFAGTLNNYFLTLHKVQDIQGVARVMWNQ